MTTLEKQVKKNPLLNYFQESYQELQKVTWPTRNRAIRLTFLVLGFCLAAAVVIGVMDYTFSAGHEVLLNMAPVAPIEESGLSLGEVKVDGGNVEGGNMSVTATPGDETPADASAGSETAPAPAPETSAPTEGGESSNQ